MLLRDKAMTETQVIWLEKPYTQLSGSVSCHQCTGCRSVLTLGSTVLIIADIYVDDMHESQIYSRMLWRKILIVCWEKIPNAVTLFTGDIAQIKEAKGRNICNIPREQTQPWVYMHMTSMHSSLMMQKILLSGFRLIPRWESLAFSLLFRNSLK